MSDDLTLYFKRARFRRCDYKPMATILDELKASNAFQILKSFPSQRTMYGRVTAYMNVQVYKGSGMKAREHKVTHAQATV